MRWIYVSPHLDDAVLSAGGLIFDQVRSGLSVEIWTVVCGFPPEGDELSPFAQLLHAQWGFTTAEETVRLRRAEDQRAAAILGAKPVQFDGFPDCIYRRGMNGEHLYPLDVFVKPSLAEADLPAKITAALASRLEPEDVLVCPLGIGNHADHLLVRKAVEGLNLPLWYYADVPYVLRHSEALDPATSAGRVETRKISSAGLNAWVDGIITYASQISTLFESLEEVREAMAEYGREGLRLWKFE